ncbi:hypothetical protein GCM10023318_31770 [Nocardia callitridis]|uniref:Uncharacterized protein n=1 Tax=Nocardia callitridis TaxID=648753 RepID=A0ABP9KET2_9NOCA
MGANYRALGYQRLVYTDTASVSAEVIDQSTEAMGDHPNGTGVLLTRTDATAHRRIGQREIGSELDIPLERSAAMARRLEGCSPSWVHRIATDDRTTTEIATAVVLLTEWLPSPSRTDHVQPDAGRGGRNTHESPPGDEAQPRRQPPEALRRFDFRIRVIARVPPNR